MKEFKGIYQLHGSINKKIEEILQTLYKHKGLDVPSGPRIDVVIGKGYIDVYADLPGVDIDDFKVYLVENKLVIEGVKRSMKHTEKVNYLVMEREFFPFRKIIEIPSEYSFENGFAKLKDGVLHIRLEIN
ncbi:MAG: Hsp20/alpha crystallin family protein [Deferribacterales bacterium]|nr:Hsp20/alpha crystallin family protein [Deferribacterales bacterium]